MINKLKKTVQWNMLLVIVMDEKLMESFTKKNCRKKKQKKFRDEKVIKRKGNKLYIKWKGYESSFNSWINKTGIV